MRRFLILCFLWCLCEGAMAAPVFDFIFQSDMILPRGKEFFISGKTTPNSYVTLSFQGENRTTVSDSSGVWKFKMSPLSVSSRPLSLSVADKTGICTLKNVLIGDVWMASGQSNMEFKMSESSDGKPELAFANCPQVRFMKVKSRLPYRSEFYTRKMYERVMAEGCVSPVQWEECTPESAADLSAVAYYFAKHLSEEIDVPIGIIVNPVGGSGMEAWTPKEVFNEPEYKSFDGNGWLDSPLMCGWQTNHARKYLGKLLPSKKEIMHPYKPSFLFENMVRPYVGFPIKGVIWYQGETNAESRNDAYNEKLMTEMITGWRLAFYQKNLPFLMVQLPRINDETALRARWAQFREVQKKVSDKLPEVGLVCTIDLGSTDSNVHPTAKKMVAERLMQLALNSVYGKGGYLSPQIVSSEIKGNKVVLTCSDSVNSVSGHVSDGFELANESGQFVPAQVQIHDQTIVLSSDKVKVPTGVRYQYATFVQPNLASTTSRYPLFPFYMPSQVKDRPSLPLGKYPKSGKIRVACVGDSITFGFGLEKDEDRYPEKLGKLLGEKFEVKRFGNSGKTAGDYPSERAKNRWFGAQVEFLQAIDYQADIYIVNLGINDTCAWWNPQCFESGYLFLVKELKGNRNPTIVVWQKLGPDYRGALGQKAYPGNCFKDQGFTFSLKDNSTSKNRPLAESIIAKMAKREKWYTMDAYTPMSHCPELYKVDGLHPTAEGASRLAKLTYDWLARYYKLVPKK